VPPDQVPQALLVYKVPLVHQAYKDLLAQLDRLDKQEQLVYKVPPV
jgi:hypothetical protein